MPLFYNPNSWRYISELSKVGTRISSSESDIGTTGSNSTWDVIIVGGGTSGCVLAARLSEDPSIRVLLLEAGGSGYNLFTRVPGAYSKLFYDPKQVFQLYTEPDENTKGRKLFWPRAKMLGGCSSINAEMAQYGAPGDFDEWARITGDESWSWKNFSPFWNSESLNATCHIQPSPALTYLVKEVQGPVKACENLKIPFSPDFNQVIGTKGVNRNRNVPTSLLRLKLVTYIDEKLERVSSESAYLTKEVLNRPNLKVAVRARVTKILFEKRDGEILAVGVEFANSRKGPRFRARSLKEVVLSAGAIHSPQLLLLSGVGPSKHLQEQNISVVHDLPGVGSQLIDHPVVDFYFKDKTDTAPAHMIPHTLGDHVRYAATALRYFLQRWGHLASNWGEGAAFCRSDDLTLFPPEEFRELKVQDKIFTTALAYKEHGRVGWKPSTFAIHVVLLRPLSKGSITLKSDSPWDHPIITPNYLQDDSDISKLLLELIGTMKGEGAETLDTYTDQKTDEELEEIPRELSDIIRRLHAAWLHLSKEGILDSQLRVYGIKGLRVCDASVFPNIVSGHTAGACFASRRKIIEDFKERVSD
ncbi:alcohol oxidase [Gymnopus androsaceus JB14]|uniref:Alcohol oxidase n=1 Tax=Gymnopus androsaceus JB14 TaxID=1447944 RepID=A0A6A4I1W0_9AGAR|nr:alcohol oxidase [Gymnopus androsaceus JB14]